MHEKVRFHPTGTGFHAAVKRRVDEHFARRGVARTANAAMIAKTAFWLAATATTWTLAVSGVLPPLLALAAAAALGFCLAGVGFNVGHDAIHGAYARRPWVNHVLGWTFQAIGASSYTWSVAHNVVHHTYTNMPGHDTDLEPGPFMRFHDAQPRRAAHRFQHVYAWALYCFTSFVWILKKDFVQVLERDPRTGKRAPPRAVLSVLVAKALHAALFLVVPFAVVDLPWWQVGLGYLAMHAAAGLTLAIVFQLAHVVEGTVMPDAPPGGAMADSWAEHQLRTTSNFARGNALAHFVCGGLNHQVEHHLFPRVCHIHYPAIAEIVRATAHEHGLPYHEHRTFLGALASHARVMRALGRAPQRAPAPLFVEEARRAA